jgi:predicted enzyme related to lactoylglutathione lyase
MKFDGTLIAVSDMETAKDFYENVLEQTILMDLGTHVAFENGFSLQSDYAELVGEDLPVQKPANSFQLYFETEDLEKWYEKISKINGITMIHGIKEYPWGQRDIRFYDFDQHIIEVAESMESVVKRFLKEGLSVEETAKRTMYPVEFVKSFI